MLSGSWKHEHTISKKGTHAIEHVFLHAALEILRPPKNKNVNSEGVAITCGQETAGVDRRAQKGVHGSAFQRKVLLQWKPPKACEGHSGAKLFFQLDLWMFVAGLKNIKGKSATFTCKLTRPHETNFSNPEIKYMSLNPSRQIKADESEPKQTRRSINESEPFSSNQATLIFSKEC